MEFCKVGLTPVIRTASSKTRALGVVTIHE